jgi:hypothetical protein
LAAGAGSLGLAAETERAQSTDWEQDCKKAGAAEQEGARAFALAARDGRRRVYGTTAGSLGLGR